MWTYIIKKLIYFFNKIIFEDKLNKIDNLNLLINEKQEEEFKKYINIFINKLLIPILEKENKTNEIYELILIIAKIFLSEGNIKLILEFDENKRIFDDETVKNFLNIIYKIISVVEHLLKPCLKSLTTLFSNIISFKLSTW